MTSPDASARPVALWLPCGGRADTGTWRASAWAVGPWDANALHGGPVAALLAGAAERADAPGPMHPSTFHLELLRPVGLGEHRVDVAVTRPGRNVQVVQTELVEAETDRVVARASLQRIRVLASSDPSTPELATLARTRLTEEPTPAASLPPPSPGQRPPGFRPDEPPAFHNRAVEHCFIRGHLERLGPAIDWIRLMLPVTPAQEPTPLQRVVAAADFGNGISATLDFTRYTFINPDLTVTLHRLPVGEWVALDARTRLGTPGVATAEVDLSDQDGPIGRSVQTLLVAPR